MQRQEGHRAGSEELDGCLGTAIQNGRTWKTWPVHSGLAGSEEGSLGAQEAAPLPGHPFTTVPSLPAISKRENRNLLDFHRFEGGRGAWEPEAWPGAQLCDT